MAHTTPRQALPVPDLADDPNVPGDMDALAQAVDKRLVQVYSSASDRDTKNTAPTEGECAVLTDVNKVYVFFDSAWVQIYPTTFPAVTSGTTAPSNASGANGDIYFQV